MTRQPDENELKHIKELLQSGRKDEAIKLYRTITRAGIFETKDAIAELERQLPPPTSTQPDQSGFLLDDDAPPFQQQSDRVFDDMADIRLLAHQGEKIQAIKLYRERKGVSLEEAKRAVDAMSAGSFTTASEPSMAAPPQTSTSDALEIDKCILRGQKISAIDLYRKQHGVDLRTARDAVDAREKLLRDHSIELYHPSPTASTPGEADQIDQCILRGEKIMAIKLYREKHNVGLKEAKDAVDARETVLRASSPEQFQRPSGGQSASGPGAGFIFLMILLLLGLIYWYFSF